MNTNNRYVMLDEDDLNHPVQSININVLLQLTGGDSIQTRVLYDDSNPL